LSQDATAPGTSRRCDRRPLSASSPGAGRQRAAEGQLPSVSFGRDLVRWRPTTPSHGRVVARPAAAGEIPIAPRGTVTAPRAGPSSVAPPPVDRPLAGRNGRGRL